MSVLLSFCACVSATAISYGGGLVRNCSDGFVDGYDGTLGDTYVDTECGALSDTCDDKE